MRRTDRHDHRPHQQLEINKEIPHKILLALLVTSSAQFVTSLLFLVGNQTPLRKVLLAEKTGWVIGGIYTLFDGFLRPLSSNCFGRASNSWSTADLIIATTALNFFGVFCYMIIVNDCFIDTILATIFKNNPDKTLLCVSALATAIYAISARGLHNCDPNLLRDFYQRILPVTVANDRDDDEEDRAATTTFRT